MVRAVMGMVLMKEMTSMQRYEAIGNTVVLAEKG